LPKYWIDSPNGKRWIGEHAAVQHSLKQINSNATKSSYAQSLHAFSEWTEKTPEELIETRRIESKRGEDDNGTMDLVQEFVNSGSYKDGRQGHNGEYVKLAEARADRRNVMYSALRF
jgi:hypothetical protein